MNEYKNEGQEERDGLDSAICPRKKKKDVIFLYECKDEEVLAEAKNKALGGIFGASTALIAVVALICLLFAFNSEEEPETMAQEESAYNGIFESEAAARNCIESSVSLRLGAPDELGGESVSGVIVSSDGWILSGAPCFKGERGRIYARLYDGKDLAVEEVRYDEEGRLTLYKVSAEDLPAATVGDARALTDGEELIALSSCGAPDYACALVSGIVSHKDRSVRIEEDGEISRLDGIIQVDLSLDDGGCGAPLFDKKGKLVGISVSGDLNYFTGTEKITSFISKID